MKTTTPKLTGKSEEQKNLEEMKYISRFFILAGTSPPCVNMDGNTPYVVGLGMIYDHLLKAKEGYRHVLSASAEEKPPLVNSLNSEITQLYNDYSVLEAAVGKMGYADEESSDDASPGNASITSLIRTAMLRLRNRIEKLEVEVTSTYSGKLNKKAYYGWLGQGKGLGQGKDERALALRPEGELPLAHSSVRPIS